MKRNRLLAPFSSIAVMLGLAGLIAVYGTGTGADTRIRKSSPATSATSATVSSSQATAVLKSAESAASSETTANSKVPVPSKTAPSLKAKSGPGTASNPAAASDSNPADTQSGKAPRGRYYIEIDNILQRPELPTGCEATALTIILNHLGYGVDKCTIADDYLPITNEPYSLDTYFIGNPHSKNGLGCNAPVIVKTANQYLSDAGGKYQAKLVTGSTPDQLYQYVANGVPVICWVTIAMLDTRISATWTAKDTGRKVNFMENEHCTVLVGYDTAKGTVTLSDPWKGMITYSMPLFEKRYHQLGNQAVIVL